MYEFFSKTPSIEIKKSRYTLKIFPVVEKSESGLIDLTPLINSVIACLLSLMESIISRASWLLWTGGLFLKLYQVCCTGHPGWSPERALRIAWKSLLLSISFSALPNGRLTKVIYNWLSRTQPPYSIGKFISPEVKTIAGNFVRSGIVSKAPLL